MFVEIIMSLSFLFNFFKLIFFQSSFKQRPSAKELLKYPFIRKAKKNSFLIDLIERYKRYKAQGGGKSDSDSDASDS